MVYWVYEDLATNHALVHTASCGFCNGGAGTKRVRKRPNETKWRGPFGSLDLAKSAAAGTGRKSIGVHGCCDDRTAATHKSLGTSKRFALPVVDETTVSLEDLFHHRMLQIYVRMRDDFSYNAVRFLRAVREHGGVEHAKRALRRPVAMQSGLKRLKDEGALDHSMEAYVCDPQFAPLFTGAEIAEARRRLDEVRKD